jgi:hypothetical protein
VNAKHGRQRVRPTAITGFGIVRLDNGFETCPWNQLVHSTQEFFLAGLTALVAELAVRECKLLIHRCVLNREQRVLSHAADLFAASLGRTSKWCINAGVTLKPVQSTPIIEPVTVLFNLFQLKAATLYLTAAFSIA